MGGYWPGHDATGPNQSLRHMCAALRAEYEIFVVARDRPFGAIAPNGICGKWHDQDIGQVRYLTVGPAGPAGLRELLGMPHDLLWMNGFHDREFTLPALMLRRIGRVRRTPAVLSARGELAAGALGLKSQRKVIYRSIAHGLHLLSDVFIHATSAEEALDVERWFPWSKGVLVAPNVRNMVTVSERILARRSMTPEAPLRIVTVGRISRVKNIHFAIQTLAQVTVPAELIILGPVEDTDYFRECKKLIDALPAHVSVKVAGAVTTAEIPDAIGHADLFYSPTLGENFGHAIFEALACELPVLISDRTPWKRLSSQQAGWDLPLGDPASFAAQIDAYYAMSSDQRLAWRRGARSLAERFVVDCDAIAATRRLIATVRGSSGSIRSNDGAKVA